MYRCSCRRCRNTCSQPPPQNGNSATMIHSTGFARPDLVKQHARALCTTLVVLTAGTTAAAKADGPFAELHNPENGIVTDEAGETIQLTVTPDSYSVLARDGRGPWISTSPVDPADPAERAVLVITCESASSGATAQAQVRLVLPPLPDNYEAMTRSPNGWDSTRIFDHRSSVQETVWVSGRPYGNAKFIFPGRSSGNPSPPGWIELQPRAILGQLARGSTWKLEFHRRIDQVVFPASSPALMTASKLMRRLCTS